MTFSSHYVALAASIVLTVVSQILLKIGSVKSTGGVNALMLMGLAAFGLVTVMIVYALQTIELKTLIALSALTYIATPYAARIVLREILTVRQIIGTSFITIGIIIFLLGG
jgi:drug/metabolite transporter (DMT)-like permease